MVILAAAGVHYHLPRIRSGGQQLIQRLRLAVGAGLLAVGKGLLGRLHRRVLQPRAVGAGVIVPAALLVVHEPGQARVLSGAVGAGRGPALERIGQRDRNAGIHARAVLYHMVEPLLSVVVDKRAGRIGLRGVLRLSRSVGLRGRGRVGLRGRSSRRLGRAGYERALRHGSRRIGYEQERVLVHARRAAERSHGCGVLLAHAVGAGLVARRHRMLPGVGRRALCQAAVGRKVEAAAGLGVVDRLGPRNRAGSVCRGRGSGRGRGQRSAAGERGHGRGVLLAHAVGAGLVARGHRVGPGVGRRALRAAAVGHEVEAAAGLGVIDSLRRDYRSRGRHSRYALGRARRGRYLHGGPGRRRGAYRRLSGEGDRGRRRRLRSRSGSGLLGGRRRRLLGRFGRRLGQQRIPALGQHLAHVRDYPADSPCACGSGPGHQGLFVEHGFGRGGLGRLLGGNSRGFFSRLSRGRLGRFLGRFLRGFLSRLSRGFLCGFLSRLLGRLSCRLLGRLGGGRFGSHVLNDFLGRGPFGGLRRRLVSGNCRGRIGGSGSGYLGGAVSRRVSRRAGGGHYARVIGRAAVVYLEHLAHAAHKVVGIGPHRIQVVHVHAAQREHGCKQHRQKRLHRVRPAELAPPQHYKAHRIQHRQHQQRDYGVQHRRPATAAARAVIAPPLRAHHI